MRDERAISAVSEKYGAYCFAVANGILSNEQDSEECVNDTYVKIWNSIPPACPAFLRPFIARVTRNLALDRYRAYTREKRGGCETELALDELGDIVSNEGDVVSELERRSLVLSINLFLKGLPVRERNIFIRRYFYVESVKTIAARYGLRENHISKILSRTRQNLKEFLQTEGYEI